VTAQLPGKDLLQCLGTLPGTEGLQVTGEGDGFATVTALVAPKADPRDEAFRALNQAGAVIRELRLDLATLEQFFHDQTRDDPGVVRA
jgi:hypothetical protein